jgi:hypothetical protein
LFEYIASILPRKYGRYVDDEVWETEQAEKELELVTEEFVTLMKTIAVIV